MRPALLIILLITIGLAGGCRTEDNSAEEPAEAPEAGSVSSTHEAAEHHEEAAENQPAEHHEEAADGEAEEHHQGSHEAAGHGKELAKALPAGANKMCPMMPDEEVDPDLFVEHKGKRIYVCCKKCLKKVSGNPASWYAKAYGDK